MCSRDREEEASISALTGAFGLSHVAFARANTAQSAAHNQVFQSAVYAPATCASLVIGVGVCTVQPAIAVGLIEREATQGLY